MLALRALQTCVFLGIASTAALAQQTLTFTNTDTDPNTAGNQNQSISLLAGSTVQITPEGNLAAQCTLAGSLCTGTAGGGGSPATVSLVSSAFSQMPTNNLYPPGTTFTLTPTVGGNAEVCVRSVSSGTPSGTNWPATVFAPFAPQTVTLPSGPATYSFSMRCYGPGGASTATLLPSISTSQGMAVSCAGSPFGIPSSWSRGNLTDFNSVIAVNGSRWNPFPNSGAFGRIATGPATYQSVVFTTPTDVAQWNEAAPAKLFLWGPSQQDGQANTAAVYVTISSCPGDFRIPAAGQQAPSGDPTFARGCRNVRPRSAGGSVNAESFIAYEVSSQPSTDTLCRLTTGQTYYVNFIRAMVFNDSSPTIGAPADEQTCNLGLPSCGIQMRVE